MTTPRPADADRLAVRAPRTRMRLFFATALVALAADLISKVLVVASIEPTDPGIRLLGGALYLVQARNSGAA
ncbi:MAG TPA: hypothetical protein VF714_00100, partial [Jatrophihabitans sp.]